MDGGTSEIGREDRVEGRGAGGGGDGEEGGGVPAYAKTGELLSDIAAWRRRPP